VGGAFAASAAVHALAIAFLAADAGARGPPPRRSARSGLPLQAVLVSPLRARSRAGDRARRARARAGARARSEGDPVQAPWSAEAVRPSPPAWLYSRR
jgi:hypothetical protein